MSNERSHLHLHSQEALGSAVRGYEVRDDTIEPPLYFISSDKPGVRWDGVPIRIITDVAPHTESHPAVRYLDKPLFANDNGIIRTLDNRLVNSEDCNPNFLLTLADRISAGDMPYPEEIRAEAAEHIRAVFLDRATPRMFYDDLREFTNVIFKDDDQPETYRITGELFFKSMTTRNILAFDVHDLLHHPLQLAAWPQQFEQISKAGYIAHALPKDHPDAKRLRKLTQLTWLASFEESLITTDGQLVSFGCLNWLSPSETPLDQKPDIRELSLEEQKIAYRWHYLDALKDMFRIGIANAKEFGDDLNWVERLGYGVDDKLRALIESDDPRPFEKLEYTDALSFVVRAPESPEELFANAMKLIEEEFGRAEG